MTLLQVNVLATDNVGNVVSDTVTVDVVDASNPDSPVPPMSAGAQFPGVPAVGSGVGQPGAPETPPDSPQVT
jgi:hypothetical protein